MGTVLDKDGNQKEIPAASPLTACANCQHPELYRRKDFPKWLGIGVIATASVLTLWTENYLFLAGAALVDLFLFWVIPEIYVCYECGSEHRKLAFNPRPEIFDIAIADRHRFGAAYKGPRSTND